MMTKTNSRISLMTLMMMMISMTMRIPRTKMIPRRKTIARIHPIILLTVSNPFICFITLSDIVSPILLFFAGVVTVPSTN